VAGIFQSSREKSITLHLPKIIHVYRCCALASKPKKVSRIIIAKLGGNPSKFAH